MYAYLYVLGKTEIATSLKKGVNETPFPFYFICIYIDLPLVQVVGTWGTGTKQGKKNQLT